jgi:hypothetical protein
LELVLGELGHLCAFHTFQNIFMHVVEPGFESSIPSFFYSDGIDYCIFGGSWSNPVPALLLTTEVETLTPS